MGMIRERRRQALPALLGHPHHLTTVRYRELSKHTSGWMSSNLNILLRLLIRERPARTHRRYCAP
jgi:hypothetical protein